MSYIPHTEQEVQAMLASIGVGSIAELFSEIPPHLRSPRFEHLPESMSEMEMLEYLHQCAVKDMPLVNFIGAGAYDHHIPAAVWDVASRGEFYSAYTPYQAEASQGTLQLLYEYQTMMAQLTGMDASNASLYDGATAMSEAILMAVRLHKKGDRRRVLLAGTIHPAYEAVAKVIVGIQQIECVQIPMDLNTGCVDLNVISDLLKSGDVAACVVQQPNFFGQIESVDRLTDQIHAAGALMIGVVNPIALAVLKAPGEWGALGADIACGEGQPLGVPLSAGGPYVGFITCKLDHIRQMPGRIVGRTVDLDGREGFTLTLQAREQHIRRAKATSNICTNQSLLVIANTIYLSLMGAEGLHRVAQHSASGARRLAAMLKEIPGVSICFDIENAFHEILIELPVSAEWVVEEMIRRGGILPGYALGALNSAWASRLLVCVTEKRTDEQMAQYAQVLSEVLMSMPCAR